MPTDEQVKTWCEAFCKRTFETYGSRILNETLLVEQVSEWLAAVRKEYQPLIDSALAYHHAKDREESKMLKLKFIEECANYEHTRTTQTQEGDMNKEEFSIGAVLGLGFFGLIGWWALLLAPITGLLYERGGSGWLGTKAWRRWGVPSVVVIATMKYHIVALILCFVGSVIILSIGYGQRGSSDSGSPFGNWWLDRLGIFWGKWASRATIVCSIWGVWYGMSLVR